MLSASFVSRARASFIDGVALVVWMIGVALIHPWGDTAPPIVRILIWFGPIVFAEPLYIRFRGATPGQSWVGIRVISAEGSLPFWRLLARHVSKSLFLGTSLLFIFFSPVGQAAHDHLLGTMVVSPSPRTGFVPRSPPLQFPIRAFIVSLVLSVFAGLGAATALLLLLVIGLAVLGVELPEGHEADALLSIPLGAAYLAAQLKVLQRGSLGRVVGTGGIAPRSQVSPPV